MTRRPPLLLAAIGLGVMATGCARHQPPSDPIDARTLRLANSAFGVLQMDDLPQAFALPDCGGLGYPAISVYLSNTRRRMVPPMGNYVHVLVGLGDDVNPRRTFHWSPERGGPGVGEFCSEGSCTAMIEGDVRLAGVNQRTPLIGELNIRFRTGLRVHQRFRAAWISQRSTCE
jgi:hypothetical protein